MKPSGYKDPVGEEVGKGLLQAMDPTYKMRHRLELMAKVGMSGTKYTPEAQEKMLAEFSANMEEAVAPATQPIRDMVGAAGEFIDKPFNAFRGAVFSAWNEDESVGEALSKGWNREKNYTTGRFLYNQGVLEDQPFLRSLLGFVGDIGLDPTIALTGGASALGKAAKFGKGTARSARVSGRTAGNITKLVSQAEDLKATLAKANATPEEFAAVQGQRAMKARHRMLQKTGEVMEFDRHYGPDWRDMDTPWLEKHIGMRQKPRVDAGNSALKSKALKELELSDEWATHRAFEEGKAPPPPGMLDEPGRAVTEARLEMLQNKIKLGEQVVPPDSKMGKILAKMDPDERMWGQLEGKTRTERAQKGQLRVLAAHIPFTQKSLTLIKGDRTLWPVVDRIARAAGASPNVKAVAKWLNDTWETRFLESEELGMTRDIGRMTLAEEVQLARQAKQFATGRRSVLDDAARNAHGDLNRAEHNQMLSRVIERRLLDDAAPLDLGDDGALTHAEYEHARKFMDDMTDVEKGYVKGQTKRYDEMVPELHAAGRDDISMLDEERLGYFHHLSTPEAFKWAMRNGHGGTATDKVLSILDRQPGFAKQRKLRQQDIVEINRDFRATEGVDFDLFDTDPTRVMFARETAQLRAMADTKMVDAVRRTFGQTDKQVANMLSDGAPPPSMLDEMDVMDIPEGGAAEIAAQRGRVANYERAMEVYKRDHVRMEGTLADEAKWVPKDVFDTLTELRTRNQKLRTGIGLRMFDAQQRFWSRHLLLSNPGYHARNMVSNWYQNWLAGVYDPRDYGRAARVQWSGWSANRLLEKSEKLRAKGLVKEADALVSEANGHLNKVAWKEHGKDVTMRQALEEAVGDEILNTGAWSRGVAGLDDEVRAARAGALGLGTKVIDALPWVGERVAKRLENHSRLTHYITKRKQGLDRFAARQSVVKYLFDYGEMSKVEREVFKRVLPFY